MLKKKQRNRPQASTRQRPSVGNVSGGDAVDRRREGMINAIVARGLGRAPEPGNEWSGRSISRMAAACHPELAKRYDGIELVMAALVGRGRGGFMASHGTSDFANVLGNSANRSLLIGYEETVDTWLGWTNRGVLNDYRETPRVGLGAFSELQEVPENGEIPRMTLTDYGVSAQIRNHAGIFTVSMEAIVNDDLSVFTQVPRRQGHAARRTVGNHVYRVLTSNPTIEGAQLFSVGHNTTHDESLDAAGISALRGAMRRQTMPTGGGFDADEPANIMPRYLLTPPELHGYALEIAQAVLASGGGTNIYAGSLEVLEEPRLTNPDHWYILGSGAEVDTVEVAFLGGNDKPHMASRNGWTVAGIEYRVSLGFAVTLLGYRAMQRGTGGAPE